MAPDAPEFFVLLKDTWLLILTLEPRYLRGIHPEKEMTDPGEKVSITLNISRAPQERSSTFVSDGSKAQALLEREGKRGRQKVRQIDISSLDQRQRKSDSPAFCPTDGHSWLLPPLYKAGFQVQRQNPEGEIQMSGESVRPTQRNLT